VGNNCVCICVRAARRQGIDLWVHDGLTNLNGVYNCTPFCVCMCVCVCVCERVGNSCVCICVRAACRQGIDLWVHDGLTNLKFVSNHTQAQNQFVSNHTQAQNQFVCNHTQAQNQFVCNHTQALNQFVC